MKTLIYFFAYIIVLVQFAFKMICIQFRYYWRRISYWWKQLVVSIRVFRRDDVDYEAGSKIIHRWSRMVFFQSTADLNKALGNHSLKTGIPVKQILEEISDDNQNR
jgi:hypothetical protein